MQWTTLYKRKPIHLYNYFRYNYFLLQFASSNQNTTSITALEKIYDFDLEVGFIDKYLGSFKTFDDEFLNQNGTESADWQINGKIIENVSSAALCKFNSVRKLDF